MSEQSELREAMARIQTDVSWIRNGMEADRKEVKELRKDLRSVERRQWWLSGAAAVVGALLGIGGSNGLKS
jgi:hypothetical protein